MPNIASNEEELLPSCVDPFHLTKDVYLVERSRTQDNFHTPSSKGNFGQSIGTNLLDLANTGASGTVVDSGMSTVTMSGGIGINPAVYFNAADVLTNASNESGG